LHDTFPAPFTLLSMNRPPPTSSLFPYTTLFRSLLPACVSHPKNCRRRPATLMSHNLLNTLVNLQLRNRSQATSQPSPRHLYALWPTNRLSPESRRLDSKLSDWPHYSKGGAVCQVRR